MGFWTVFVMAVGLSMDAFAVSVANGCRIKRVTLRDALRPGWWFGGFQMLMPVLGWFGGLALRDLIQRFSHWVAFGLLVFVGGKMLFEVVRGREHEEDCKAERRSTRDMLVLAIATSIDALAVGLTLSVLRVSIWWPALLIGLVTFTFSLAGTLVGCSIGTLVKGKAEILGGLVLIGIGIKILLQGLR
ncbi:MAG: manganese efflux pump MntP family protein [Caldiserica bacterium]|jgi:manganese efflux pump family protein|nr:manganese efflux pump MntP family protein [Caldisericota bacterium]